MNPGNYHGVSAFDPDGMPDPEVAPKESFSTVFGKLLVQEGTQNPKLCAITAAMKYGTGLQFFAHRHPQRFFDVGMAEQHAVTFAAGLASQGMLPVVCIYSTFLQRSYDQIIHDVNLLKENGTAILAPLFAAGHGSNTRASSYKAPAFGSKSGGTGAGVPAQSGNTTFCMKRPGQRFFWSAMRTNWRTYWRPPIN